MAAGDCARHESDMPAYALADEEIILVLNTSRAPSRNARGAISRNARRPIPSGRPPGGAFLSSLLGPHRPDRRCLIRAAVPSTTRMRQGRPRSRLCPTSPLRPSPMLARAGEPLRRQDRVDLRREHWRIGRQRFRLQAARVDRLPGGPGARRSSSSRQPCHQPF
jgi:hypothetical protein